MGGGHDGHHGGQEDSYEQPIFKKGSGYIAFFQKVHRFFESPVIWFREKVVEPNRFEYPWYHQKFQRVRTIEKCHIWEWDCIQEAEEQFQRDKKVESQILHILRYRWADCVQEEYPDHLPRCLQIKEDYEEAAANWFTKYGDMGYYANVETAFMKQKHRLLWEKRHGPVGSGMKVDPYHVEPDEH